MRGSVMCENRETLWLPLAMAPGAAVGSLSASKWGQISISEVGARRRTFGGTNSHPEI